MGRCRQLLAVLVLLLVVAPATSAAKLVPAPGGGSLETLNAVGQPESRAGAHPDVLRLTYAMEDVSGGHPENPRNLALTLPPGILGNPHAVPFCPRRIARQGFGIAGECPPESLVGALIDKENGTGTKFLYNVAPTDDELVELVIPGFLPIAFSGRLRASDQSMVLSAENFPEADLFAFPRESAIELWGVPADHQPDPSVPRRPFLTMPTSCGAPLTATARISTWQSPNEPAVQEMKSSFPVGGCNELPFEPKAGFSLDEQRADHPSGADIELTIPQNEDLNGRASSGVKSVSVALPAGMTFAPGSATGLTRCSDEQFGRGSEVAASCPGASRIGTLQITAAALGENPAEGTIYLGTEHPGDRSPIFLVVDVRGTEMKFAGSMTTDRRTGQVTARLSDLPQLVFDSMHLRFDGGPGALLATPLTCGPAQSTATYVPTTGGPPVQSSASVTIAAADGLACGRPPFAPSFKGGSTATTAGAHTSFRALLSRRDGEQLPERVEIAFPPGMGAMLGSVGRCTDADAAAGTCPASSRIGNAVAELGPGATPAQVSGNMSLTGPYRGQPFGLAIAFPGRVGAIDFGTIVVRGSLRVDSQSGQLTAVLDSLPRLVEGVEVRFQKLSLEIDRSGFLFNPTACGPLGIATTLGSVTGQLSRGDTPFRVTNCVSLPFSPHFSLALRGGSKAKQRPSLQLAGKLRSGGANLRAAEFLLPKALTFDSANVGALCSPAGAQEGRCPAGTEVGTATAKTPMLAETLKGPIYATRPKQGRFPDLWAHLSGGGLKVSLRVQTGEEKGRATTKLREVPDLPIQTLAMNLRGGKRGIVVLRGNLCKGKPQAEGELEGHNRARLQQQLPVSTACGGKR